MATAYGRLGNHVEANKGFKAAYDLDHKYKQALIGLIYSHRNMGQFEEAYKYCDEIEPIVGKAEADGHRAAVKERETSRGTDSIHTERQYGNPDDLKKYIGTQISKEVLLGRNFFYIENQKVTEDLYLNKMPDLYIEDDTNFKQYYQTAKPSDNDFIDEYELTPCAKVKAYLASIAKQNGWFKCFPADPEKDRIGEAYILLRIRVDKDYRITEIHTFKRVIDTKGCIAGMSDREPIRSHAEYMPAFPPIILDEIDGLIRGRLYNNGFSFIGKPLPSRLDCITKPFNHKYFYCWSAFRDAYWDVEAVLDEKGLIKTLLFSTCENEESRFHLPFCAMDDASDGLDCALKILDAYTDEEYEGL